MRETLNDHQTSISTGGSLIYNLRFADDINLLGGSSGELQDLTSRLVDGANAYGMGVSAEKSKIMTNSTNSAKHDRPEVRGSDQFKYLGPCAKMTPAQQKSVSGLLQQ